MELKEIIFKIFILELFIALWSLSIFLLNGTKWYISMLVINLSFIVIILIMLMLILLSQ